MLLSEMKKQILPRKELIALLMESPFYFEMSLRERLRVIRYNEQRFFWKTYFDNVMANIDSLTHLSKK